MPRRSSSQTTQTISVAGHDVELTRKRVRNINLRIGSDGTVRVSAPQHVPLEQIVGFIESRADWIARAVARSATKHDRFALSCEEGAKVALWGTPLTCHITDAVQGIGRLSCSFEVSDGRLVAHMRPDLATDEPEARTARCTLLADWLATQLLERSREIMPIWEEVVGRRCTKIRVRTMKTRWGSCNVRTGVITLNAHLAHLDPRCLEYVICHELCHLHEPNHSARFHALMDRFYPDWRSVRDLLEDRL